MKRSSTTPYYENNVGVKFQIVKCKFSNYLMIPLFSALHISCTQPQKPVEVHTPVSKTVKPASGPNDFIIYLMKDSAAARFYGDTVSFYQFEGLKAFLKNQINDIKTQKILINTSANTKYEEIQQIIEILNELDIKTFSLVTEVEKVQ